MILDFGAKPRYWDVCLAAERGDNGLVELLIPRATRYDLRRLAKLTACHRDFELFCSIVKLGITHTQWSPDKYEDHPLHLALLGHHLELI